MAGLESLAVVPGAARSAGSAAAVVADAEVFVDGLVDADKERQRLEKEIAALERSIANITAKLADAGFAAKAPPQVVAKENQRLTEYHDRLEKFRSQLSALS
ncbi:MAG: hypothetical protein MUF78_03840 [Candidatus Edwardsbacteria bacterium]|nr:hypothetical protein [Candidatus Edwardsbacteria bacterium]